MNKNAFGLKMNNTHFDSPHGLSNWYNVSTAYDLAILCSEWVKSILFNRITRTKTYYWKGRNNIGINFSKTIWKEYNWNNTNKLLERGFIGIKTGVTHSAGQCLATYLKWKKRSYIVVLLNWSSAEQKFKDAWKVIEHCQLKIRWGLINEMKPISTNTNSNNVSSLGMINISQSEYADSTKNITYNSFDKVTDDNNYFKRGSSTINIIDEDKVTTSSSNSD